MLINHTRYKVIKIYLVLLITILLTACASKSGKSDQPCKGRNCKTTDLLDNTASKQEWYCYGKENGGSWHCGNEEDSSQIVTLSVQRKAVQRKPVQEKKSPLLTNHHSASTKTSSSAQQKPLAQSTSTKGQGILDLPREFYTIQIMALAEKDKVSQFALKNNLDSALIAHTISRGSKWYVLLLGFYPNFTDAKKARLEWQEANPNGKKPWIRELGPLQDSLVKVSNDDSIKELAEGKM